MKISIITVCFNSASTIRDTINSVRSQDYENKEYIIIDGKSSDDTLSIVNEYKDDVCRLVSEPDRGIYDAMNKGIALSSGDVVGFINADDYYASKQVLEMVAEVFGDPSVDACFGDLCYVKPLDTSKIIRYWRSADFRPGLFSEGWCPPHPTFFVRRRVYQSFGCFDLSYSIAADVELMMRFLEVHRIRSRYLPKVLVTMRMGGTTNKNLRNIVRQNGEILRALKVHGLLVNPLIFFGRKLLSRGEQFVLRPRTF